MINEVLLVKELLNGNGISKDCIYQHCYLIAKFYLQTGTELLTVRDNIFEWATKNGLYLDIGQYNVNQIIYKAQNDKRRLRENISICISDADIAEINRRFDDPKVKKVALGILCYAKATSDQDNRFDLSVASFSNWVDIRYKTMYNKYLIELQDYQYIKRMASKNKKSIYSWNNKVKTPSPNFKLLVQWHNEGSYQLIDNNLDALYQQCFE